MCIAPGAVRSSPIVRGRSLIFVVFPLVGVLGLVASACAGGSDTKAKAKQPSTTATTAAPTTAAPTTMAVPVATPSRKATPFWGQPSEP